ncbi:hypothetical protein [Paludisphaera rhizosphaerae]|uniref:hypothetical protein n=1 Tax=Paludisphaera rhizosphaerae TaxID=2711216 RepID=UPI0013ED0835|nr:hypothetical protein [Paludisphaera rhizosphaerae]
MRRFCRSVVALALSLIFVGCGDSSSTPPGGMTVPVKGIVTYKGKPLAQGTVVFEPDAGREAQGEVGPDGSFTLSTFAKDDGAVPGSHRVAVKNISKSVLPLKYQNLASSGIEVVVSAEKGAYTVDLK